jgi:hypothetical protein
MRKLLQIIFLLVAVSPLVASRCSGDDEGDAASGSSAAEDEPVSEPLSDEAEPPVGDVAPLPEATDVEASEAGADLGDGNGDLSDGGGVDAADSGSPEGMTDSIDLGDGGAADEPPLDSDEGLDL